MGRPSIYRKNLTQPINKGLVGWWSFDDLSTGNVVDHSGYNYNGTLQSSPVLVDGKIGKAMDFDGADDYLTISSSLSGEFTNEVTVSTWLNHDGAAFSNYAAVVTEKQTGGSDNVIMSIAGYQGGIAGNSATKIAAAIYVVGTGWVGVNQTGDWNFGEWQHVAASYDGKTIKLYINGELNNSATLNLALPADDNDEWRIGRRHDGGNYIDGKIDDVRIYNRALSVSDISELYQNQSIYFSQGGTISGNTVFSDNISVSTINLGTNTTPSSPQTGDLFSSGSNLMYRSSTGGWISLVDLTSSVWSDASGNLSYTAGSVGIGSLSGAQFTVDNQASSDNILDLYDYNTLAFTIQDGGFIGLGTDTPTYKLHVAGNAAVSSDLSITSTLTLSSNLLPSANNTYFVGSTTYAWRKIYSQDFIVLSDRKLKTDIEDLGTAVDLLKQLEPVQYTWKSGEDDKEIGFLAQDVLKVIPEVVRQPKDKKAMLGLKYHALVPVIIQAQKDHHKTWKSRSQKLRERIRKMKKLSEEDLQ